DRRPARTWGGVSPGAAQTICACAGDRLESAWLARLCQRTHDRGPLHWAIRGPTRGVRCLTAVCELCANRPFLRRSALDVAADLFLVPAGVSAARQDNTGPRSATSYAGVPIRTTLCPSIAHSTDALWKQQATSSGCVTRECPRAI